MNGVIHQGVVASETATLGPCGQFCFLPNQIAALFDQEDSPKIPFFFCKEF